MYLQHFGLKQDPFAMTADPDFLAMTAVQREALAGMVYAIMARKGFVVLTGEAGTGKTTLLAKLMRMLAVRNPQFSLVLNPTLSPNEFLESALLDFGIATVPPTKLQRLLKLYRLLLEGDRNGRASVLVVDEAHKLPTDVLEEIRLLSNFERPTGKLLQIVLAGQPELAEMLDRSNLQQLKQRIAVRLTIGRLSATEVEAYISYRWKTAGGLAHPFTMPAVQLVTRYSSGIPRLINSVCDNALLLAMADGALEVTPVHVQEAARDLSLQGRRFEPAMAAAQAAAAGPPPAASAPVPVPILERYARQKQRKSLIGRWIGRLRWAE